MHSRCLSPLDVYVTLQVVSDTHSVAEANIYLEVDYEAVCSYESDYICSVYKGVLEGSS